MMDRQTDRRTGKNNMSPDPVGGRHNNFYVELEYCQNMQFCFSGNYIQGAIGKYI